MIIEPSARAKGRVFGSSRGHRRATGSHWTDGTATQPSEHGRERPIRGSLHTDPTGDDWTPEDVKGMRAQKLPFRCHAFEAACADLEIEHRLTKALPSKVEGPRHP